MQGGTLAGWRGADMRHIDEETMAGIAQGLANLLQSKMFDYGSVVSGAYVALRLGGVVSRQDVTLYEFRDIVDAAVLANHIESVLGGE